MLKIATQHVKKNKAAPAAAFSTEKNASCSMLQAITSELYTSASAPQWSHVPGGRSASHVCSRINEMKKWAGPLNTWAHNDITLTMREWLKDEVKGAALKTEWATYAGAIKEATGVGGSGFPGGNASPADVKKAADLISSQRELAAAAALPPRIADVLSQKSGAAQLAEIVSLPAKDASALLEAAGITEADIRALPEKEAEALSTLFTVVFKKKCVSVIGCSSGLAEQKHFFTFLPRLSFSQVER